MRRVRLLDRGYTPAEPSASRPRSGVRGPKEKGYTDRYTGSTPSRACCVHLLAERVHQMVGSVVGHPHELIAAHEHVQWPRR
ncbi:MAG: hypothetical protein IPF64_16360 [Flavobacteriales bacterium]|nr:hypothetical protein [Flavobacteriales bacterium]